jgi:hypothetical protein
LVYVDTTVNSKKPAIKKISFLKKGNRVQLEFHE